MSMRLATVRALTAGLVEVLGAAQRADSDLSIGEIASALLSVTVGVIDASPLEALPSLRAGLLHVMSRLDARTDPDITGLTIQ